MRKYKFRRVYALNLIKNRMKNSKKKDEAEEKKKTNEKDCGELWKWVEYEGKYDFRAVEERNKLDDLLKEFGY